LIGEHIDYALFGVFPAAIERDILIALAPRPPNDKPSVIVANADPKHAEQTFSPSRAIATAGARDQDAWLIDINTNELRWDSYVKAGYYVSFLHTLFRLAGLVRLSRSLSGRPEQFLQRRRERSHPS
jgi:galactokinase